MSVKDFDPDDYSDNEGGSSDDGDPDMDPSVRKIRMDYLPKADEQWVAAYLVDKIREEELAAREKVQLPDGTYRPQNDWEAYQALVQKQVDLVDNMPIEGSGAVYIPAEESASGNPAIFVTRNMKDKKKAIALIHEVSNHKMREDVAPDCYGVDVVICRKQNNRAKRHKMAKTVEKEIIGF